MMKPAKTQRGKPKRATQPGVPKTRVQRVYELMGKYAWVPGGSEEFAREKVKEIEREERKFTRHS